jgi:hypothetical protein
MVYDEAGNNARQDIDALKFLWEIISHFF